MQVLTNSICQLAIARQTDAAEEQRHAPSSQSDKAEGLQWLWDSFGLRSTDIGVYKNTTIDPPSVGALRWQRKTNMNFDQQGETRVIHKERQLT